MLLTVNPIGGLANRLRAIAAAIALARDAKCDLRLVWGVNDELKAAFADLFEMQPFGDMGIAAPESFAPLPYRLLYECPRRKNLYFPTLWQKLKYDERIVDDTPRMAALRDNPAELLKLARTRNLYIQAGTPFYPFDPAVYPKLYIPTAEIARKISAITDRFSPCTIGCHIRRTDNAQSILRSPTELFIESIRREQAAHPDLKVLLCTDDEPTKAQLKALFGQAVITSPNRASRSSLAGMKEAVAELYALSRTRKIYGSYYSSFSEAANMLTAVPITQLTTP